ncbi:MAG: hypothetical protein ABIW80_08490 [Lapillicoccus sp.]
MRRVLAGAGLGLALGVAARWWMRLVSTQPELSWSGTGLILALFTTAGVGLGIAAAARAAGRSRWWRLTAVLAVPVLLSPGMVLAPALVVGGWGLRRGPRARVAAAAAVLVAPAVLVVATWADVEQSLMPYPDGVYRGVLALGAALLGAAFAWGGSAAFGPWAAARGDGPPPSGERAAVGTAGGAG